MTDTLTRLLHDAGSRVDVPAPPAREVLAEGRTRRRRRTGAVAGGGVLAAAVVLGAALLVPAGGDDRAVDPVTPSGEPTFEGVTYAIGDEVYLDGGAESVTVDDRAVKSMYYSSAGVVVRHGDNSFSDGGGPQRFTLVRPDGTSSPISVETEENAHGVDPDQPYLAWTEVVPGGVEVVVHDVDTDTEVARVPVQGRFEWSPPPVSLDGDTVYLGGRPGADTTLLAVDWRTGAVTDSGLPAYFPEVHDGRSVVSDAAGTRVVDVASGEELVAAPEGGDSSISLSPDGRYAVATTFDPDTFEESRQVLDVATGEPAATDADLQGRSGWSAQGQVFGIDGDRLSVCSVVTGDCETRRDPRLADAVDDDGNVEIQLGGVLYES